MLSENAVNMNVRNAGTQRRGGTNCRRTRPTNRQGARRDTPPQQDACWTGGECTFSMCERGHARCKVPG
eukprot:scaffold2529_cov122-Isochrysis_galbana.AAC.7